MVSRRKEKRNIETNIDLLHVTYNKHDIHNLFINMGMKKKTKQETLVASNCLWDREGIM